MEATELLRTLMRQGVEVSVNGDKIRLAADGDIPPELVAAVKSQKEELMRVLTVPSKAEAVENPRKPKLVEGKPPEWHAEQVARLVEETGICMFWSETAREVIAFVKDDFFRGSVPAGIVTYSKAEAAYPRSQEDRRCADN